MRPQFLGHANKAVHLYLTEELPVDVANAIIGVLRTEVDSNLPLNKYVIEFAGTPLLPRNPLTDLRIRSRALQERDLVPGSQAIEEFKKALHDEVIGRLMDAVENGFNPDED